jgi:hypothetical protein
MPVTSGYQELERSALTIGGNGCRLDCDPELQMGSSIGRLAT